MSGSRREASWLRHCAEAPCGCSKNPACVCQMLTPQFCGTASPAVFVGHRIIKWVAIVDGCDHGKIFIKIVFLLARNTIITIASMYSVLIWNDFIFANTFISDSNAKTVAMGLKDYVGAFGNVDGGLLLPQSLFPHFHHKLFILPLISGLLLV